MRFWAKHFRKRCYFSVQDHQKSAGRFYRLDIILTDFSKYNRISGDFCHGFLSDFHIVMLDPAMLGFGQGFRSLSEELPKKTIGTTGHSTGSLLSITFL